MKDKLKKLSKLKDLYDDECFYLEKAQKVLEDNTSYD